MISVLSRIVGYAAKGIYALIVANGGCCSVSEMEAAGYKKTVRFDALAELTESGVIVKVGVGVYRVAKSGGADSESGGADFEQLLESKTDRKYKRRKSGGADCESGRPDFCENPVNVNVNDSCKKQTKAGKIKSTSEIPGIISGLPDAARNLFEEKCKLIRGCFSAIDNVSLDLIHRIAAVELIFGIRIELELLNSWRRDSLKAEKDKRVRFAWIALSRCVERFYDELGVQWTKCRTPDAIKFENRMKVLQGLTIVTPKGEQTASEFLSFKQCDDMERFVKGRKNARKGGENGK